MQPDVNNLKNKINENHDFLNKIALDIPSFKGYIEKTVNYDADMMIRSFIADRILYLKKEINTLSGNFVKKGNLYFVQDFESLSIILEGILKKVQYADYGSTGSFSKIKFTEEDQNRLLEYDWRLISIFDEVCQIFKEVEIADDNILESIDKMLSKLKDFEKNFDDRKYVILEVI